VKAKAAGFSWLSKVKNPLNSLLLLATSVQLGLHFWPPSALVYGIRIDYLSPTLFAFDLGLILALLINRPQSTIHHLRPLLLLALSNLLFSLTPLQTLIWWSRLTLLILWASTLDIAWLRKQVTPLLVGLTVLLIIGLSQILVGGSLQGPLYWLGERRFSLGQPGLALQTILGVTVLRAYSLFSHPNIFAGWSMFVVYLVTRFAFVKSGFKTLPYLLGAAIVLVTASRAAALSLILLAIFAAPKNKGKLLLMTGGVLMTSYLMLVRPESVVVPRLTLLQTSLDTLARFPLFGTGALGSITAYPLVSPILRFLQPDHFAPTLLLSWIGLIGMAQLMLAIKTLNKKYKIINNKLLPLLPLLPLLIFDHYLLTSSSGLAIFVVVLRFTLSRSPSTLQS
jgi:hypothetical protein